MLRRFLAPFLVLSLVFSVITIVGLNSKALAKPTEANQDYFIKPISRADVVVVEPNYGHFYHPNPQVEGDSFGEILYNSLDDLDGKYEIRGTKMVRFERKGQMIPNLYVYVD